MYVFVLKTKLFIHCSLYPMIDIFVKTTR